MMFDRFDRVKLFSNCTGLGTNRQIYACPPTVHEQTMTFDGFVMETPWHRHESVGNVSQGFHEHLMAVPYICTSRFPVIENSVKLSWATDARNMEVPWDVQGTFAQLR